MGLERSIRKRLAKLVDGSMSLRSFNRWFTPATWDVDTGPESLRSLISAVKQHLDEYDNGHLTRDGLKDRLTNILVSDG